MNKFITKIFKSAGVNAKVTRDTKAPRFKVVDNSLVLEGVITANKYTMKITDKKGKIVDNLSVDIENSNDIVNRINESIGTLKMLSSVYDKTQLHEEEEEFEEEEYDDVVINDDSPEDLKSGLAALYDAILDVAEKSELLSDVADTTDAEQLSTLLGFTSNLYDCAMDVEDYREDLIADEEKEEDIDESVSRKLKRSDIQKAIDNLVMAESVLRKNKSYTDIARAIKDVKSELIVRGK